MTLTLSNTFGDFLYPLFRCVLRVLLEMSWFVLLPLISFCDMLRALPVVLVTSPRLLSPLFKNWQTSQTWSTWQIKCCYYTLNSLSLLWLAASVRWIFEISACEVMTADYTIIMSRTLKVTGNHVIHDRGACFLREFLSSLRALCCLPSVKKQRRV